MQNILREYFIASWVTLALSHVFNLKKKRVHIRYYEKNTEEFNTKNTGDQGHTEGGYWGGGGGNSEIQFLFL